MIQIHSINKVLQKILLLFSVAALFVACDGNRDKQSQKPGREYVVDGTIHSVEADSLLYLYVDEHDNLRTDTLDVREGKFSFEGLSEDVDEVFLQTPYGQIYRFYVAGGMHMTIEIDSMERIHFDDTINDWLKTETARMDDLDIKSRQRAMDSICAEYAYSVRATLLMRNQIDSLADSLFVRQCLGRIQESAKPMWLNKSIDAYLDEWSVQQRQDYRLPTVSFVDQDGKGYKLRDLNDMAQLVLFWAEYDSLSISKLSSIDTLARKYGIGQDYAQKLNKKGEKARALDVLTICLGSDSVVWQARIENLPGRHVLLRDGFNAQWVRLWHIQSLPYILLMDRTGKLMHRQPNHSVLATKIETLPYQLVVDKKDNIQNKSKKGLSTRTR